MSYLTDVDIKRLLGRDIVIEPFLEESLTPIGYDFCVGDFVYSLENGLLKAKNGYYFLPPKSTVQILTKEALWVSSKIAGTFHSKVSLVSKGLSHISTTLDPGWFGPLLIILRNNTDKEFKLKVGAPFVTLIFSRVLTPTRSNHYKPAFRKDILASQMENQTNEYIKKISDVLSDPKSLVDFQEKVKKANAPMVAKILASVRSKGWREMIHHGLISLISISTIALITLNIYWEKVKYLFNDIPYDSKIFAVQMTAIISLVSLLISLKRK